MNRPIRSLLVAGSLLLVAGFWTSTVAAASPDRPAITAVHETGTAPSGYVLAARDGSSYSFSGTAAGSTRPMPLARPVVGMASVPAGGGYWLVASDGGIFTFGDARFHGSTGAVHLNQPIVGMAPTPSGNGYWLVAADGGIFSFGDARFYGSGSGLVSAPVVGISRPTKAPVPASGLPVGGAEFDHPSGLAFANGYLWVTNQAGNSLTEILPADPARWVATYSGFSSPRAIAAYGTDLFVANGTGSVTEVSAASPSVVRYIAGSAYHFSDPSAVAIAGSTLLVLNSGSSGASGSLTEINANTGSLIRVIAGPSYSFSDPVAMAVAGTHVYVADKGSNDVTDITIASGGLVRVISGAGLDGPDGAAYDNGYVWVSNSANDSATRITAATDAAAQYSSGSYGFGSPSAIAASNGYIYVLSPFGSSPMVTKIDDATGTTPWYMCNTNGPYYFSDLSAVAIANGEVWVASADGANYPDSRAATGSLTELYATYGGVIQTVP
jgi:hypothetical protein